MQRKPSYGAIAQTYRAQGEIVFPGGGRIQSRAILTHYITGRYLLACEGRFAPETYPAWEQLVHQYRVDPRRSLETARRSGCVERFVGRLDDDRPLTLNQMVLITAQAQGLTLYKQNLLLQMVFDCQDVRLGP